MKKLKCKIIDCKRTLWTKKADTICYKHRPKVEKEVVVKAKKYGK